MKRRGFTLLELCVAVVLTSILLGFTFLSLRQPIAKAGCRVVAEQTGEFLRRARNRAQTENTPVAVVFPTNGGASPFSQSIAERAGEVNPVIKRIKDFSGDNPGTVICVGTYGSGGTWSISPLTSGGSDSFVRDVNTFPGTARIIEWVGSAAVEPMVIFMPDGTAVGNDLPHLNGAYRVVVSEGVSITGGSAGGTGVLPTRPAINRLTEVSNPYTITVDSSGAVQVGPGLADGDGSTSVSTNALALGSPAPRMLIPAETAANPVITTLTVAPSAGYLKGAFGFEQIVKAGRQLTFQVRATQSNDEELSCLFEEASGQGQFSSPGFKKMRYQPPAPPFIPGGWVGTWQWTPPENTVPGTMFQVNATVMGSRGGFDTTDGDATFETDIISYDIGRIFFGAQVAFTGRSEIYSVSADGTDLNRVTYQEVPGTSQMGPAASRDGNKLLYQSVDLATLTSSLYGQSRRGGIATLITDAGVNAAISDDATVTAFQHNTGWGSPAILYTVNPDILDWPPQSHPVFSPEPVSSVGLNNPSISPPLAWDVLGPRAAPPDFVADPANRRCKMPRRIAFEANMGDLGGDPWNVAIYTADFHDPGRSIALHNLVRQTAGGPGGDIVNPGGDRRPVFHPDGTKMAFYSRQGGTLRIYAIPFKDSSGPLATPTLLTPGFTNARDPSYSPDGTMLVFASDDHDPGGDWDLYIVSLEPSTDYLTPLGAPSRMRLGEYSLFNKTFDGINRPVWTL